MNEFKINVNKYPVYFKSPNDHLKLKFSDKVLFQSLFVLNTYLDNFDEYLVDLIENELDDSLVLYKDEVFDIFERFINNILGSFIVDIARPYMAKYPEHKFHQIIELDDDYLLELYDVTIVSDEEIAMRILDLIPEFFEIMQEIRKITRESNIDVLSRDIPDEFFTIFTTQQISPFAFLKASVRVFAKIKFIEELKDKKKRS